MPGTWREQQKDALRARLLSTSLELFRTNGFEKTTVQEIAEAVGVGKGTFFNHFPTKVMVVAEWYRNLTADALAEVEGRPHATAREGKVCIEMILGAYESAKTGRRVSLPLSS